MERSSREPQLIGHLEALMAEADRASSEPPEELLTGMAELDDPDDDPSEFEEPGPLVCARLRPRPTLSSGAIALSEPDDEEDR
jgi:hypothetical protein